MKPTNFSKTIGVVALALTVCGCGSKYPATTPVSGTVTYKGQPVEGATVTLVPAPQGKAGTAMTDASGNFKISSYRLADGAVPGEYIVTISKMEVAGQKKVDNGPDAEAGVETVFKNKIPDGYRDPIKSSIVAKVPDDGEEVKLNVELSDQ